MTAASLTALRSGYTTGACAAAACKGAAQMLALQKNVAEVTIELPTTVSATFQLNGQTFGNDSATCFVIKDAGDDPDVTNGVEVWATVTAITSRSLSTGEVDTITITGGVGIGRVTKPGLAIPPGQWAINPVPRQMILQAVSDVFPQQAGHRKLNVTISIPDGEKRAEKTLNARLGIIGGLSILGTTGIVRPVSAKAWTDTIDSALDVAKACGCQTVVFSTGRTSEMAAQRHISGFSEEAFIMMGDHIAHTLRASAERCYYKPVIACQFAKLLKIACGHDNTHAAASELDLAQLKDWADKDQLPQHIRTIIANGHTAREIFTVSGYSEELAGTVLRRAHTVSQSFAPGISPHFLLAGYDGVIVHEYR